RARAGELIGPVGTSSVRFGGLPVLCRLQCRRDADTCRLRPPGPTRPPRVGRHSIGALLSPTFAELGVPADLVSILHTRDIATPFPIQAAALPDALAGLDVCGRAPTGSGKTLAFGLALVVRLPKA